MQYIPQGIVQEEAENLIAFMLERDEEIRARLRRITQLAEMQRKATRKNGTREIALADDFKRSA